MRFYLGGERARRRVISISTEMTFLTRYASREFRVTRKLRRFSDIEISASLAGGKLSLAGFWPRSTRLTLWRELVNLAIANWLPYAKTSLFQLQNGEINSSLYNGRKNKNV